ncbi:hypothetical protein BGLA2_30018 [Burkholderia gladioli]|nr:hypothetical protein BGLA2_30018 [Burkholderia gladioli]
MARPEAEPDTDRHRHDPRRFRHGPARERGHPGRGGLRHHPGAQGNRRGRRDRRPAGAEHGGLRGGRLRAAGGGQEARPRARGGCQHRATAPRPALVPGHLRGQDRPRPGGVPVQAAARHRLPGGLCAVLLARADGRRRRQRTRRSRALDAASALRQSGDGLGGPADGGRAGGDLRRLAPVRRPDRGGRPLARPEPAAHGAAVQPDRHRAARDHERGDLGAAGQGAPGAGQHQRRDDDPGQHPDRVRAVLHALASRLAVDPCGRDDGHRDRVPAVRVPRAPRQQPPADLRRRVLRGVRRAAAGDLMRRRHGLSRGAEGGATRRAGRDAFTPRHGPPQPARLVYSIS